MWRWRGAVLPLLGEQGLGPRGRWRDQEGAWVEGGQVLHLGTSEGLGRCARGASDPTVGTG